MKILSNLARTLSATCFAKEVGLTVVPMEGYSNRSLSGSFGWLNSKFLGGAVEVFVIVDRDYRSSEVVNSHILELQKSGVHAHVWARKELESYLLVVDAIARVSGVDLPEVKKMLNEAVEGLRAKVFSRYLAEQNLEKRPSGVHLSSITERALGDFDKNWKDPSWRLGTTPPKDILSALNANIQEVGGRAVSMRGLSARLRADEIPTEMKEVIWKVESLLRSDDVKPLDGW